jgi:hypothetical protein
MDNLLSLRRSALIYGLCLLLAILLGYLLASPGSFETKAFLALLFGVLSLPLLMRWHHSLLILVWNSPLLVPFLPGQPDWWMCLSFVSFVLAILWRIMAKKSQFLSAPAVTFWICFLFMTVIVTAMSTGGIAARAIGSTAFGGKRYLLVICAIVGYFALIGTRIRPEHAVVLAVGFFLSGAASAISDFAYTLGPAYYFLYYLFPPALAYAQVSGETTSVERFAGISFAAQAGILALLTRYGFRQLFDLGRPWRLFLFCLLLVSSLFGGFRSVLIILLLFFFFQFHFERLFTIQNTMILVGSLVLLLAFLVTLADRLPAPVQRTFSFLPLRIDERVRRDAVGTSDWRWFMWKTVVAEVPRYFWLGKGFTFSGTDMYLTEEGVRRGYYSPYEATMVSGNYHNGILTVIIPFGIWGLIGLMGFFVASTRVLYLNYRHGDLALKTVNTALLSWQLARLVIFFTIYGAFDLDFPSFVGIAALSLSLNGGVRRERHSPTPETEMAAPVEAAS